MAGFAAIFTASQARSISAGLARAMAQISALSTFEAISRTD